MTMSSALALHSLILNRNWTPITTTTVKRSMMLMFVGAAKAVCPDTYQVFEWEDWAQLEVGEDEPAIQAVSSRIKVPDVLVLSNYGGIPSRQVSFTRRNLYKRYGNQCAYCSDRFGETELTIDHVIPSSQGGRTGWDNCVLACYDCNQKKGAKTPEQASMPLKYRPTKPAWSAYALVPKSLRKQSWAKFSKKNK